MRILIYGINFSPELTGIGKYTSELANFLYTKNHHVKAITAYPYYPEWKIHPGYKNYQFNIEKVFELKSSSLQVYRCPLWIPKHPNGIRRILHLASFAISSCPILLHQYFWKPDLIIVIEPTFFCVPQSILLAKVCKAKSALHIQDFEFDAAFNFGIFSSNNFKQNILKIESWLMNKFDFISTISKEMRSNLLKKNIPSNKAYYFPNWVNADLFNINIQNSTKYKQILNLPAHKILVVYSGNMGAKQGISKLADVAQNFSNNPDILFIFCGEGSSKVDLLKQCKNLSNVIFLDLRSESEFPIFLSIADIHIMPQKKGAQKSVMPSRLLGMLASGRPIVAMAKKSSDVGKIVNKCGFVTQEGDTEEFCAAISKLSRNKALRVKLGNIAKEIACLDFDRKIILNKFEESLQSLFKGE